MNGLAPVADRAITPCHETRLSVPGMRCAGCISKLETGLASEPGIASARVDFSAKQVRIAHVPDLKLPDLIAALDRLGFDAQALAVETAEDPEHKQLIRALGVAGFAAMNIMLLSVSVWSGAVGGSRDLFHWLSAAIAIPAVAYAGRPFFASAWGALRRGRTNMDVPISIGVTLATAMSLYETMTHGAHAWFDGAVMLLFFLLAGRVLDSMMRDKARKGAASLMEASAPGAMILDEQGVAHWHDAAMIRPGMIMLIAAGERLAADGVIETGISRMDQAMLTGESAAQPVGPGAEVLAAMVNLDAPVTVRVTAAGDNRTIASLARAMQDAGQHRDLYVRIADRASRLYAPAVHSLAALSFAGWMLAGAGWHQSLLVAAAVLIITCPCALGLAVPVAQVVASGALMRRGILIKDGSALERLAEADRALLDKTGTVTMGRPQPLGLDSLTPLQASVALALAQASRHPLSRSLSRALAGLGIIPGRLANIAEQPGHGMTAMLDGRPVALTRPDGDTIGDGDNPATLLSIAGVNRRIDFADGLRPDAQNAVHQLAVLGLPVSILSGDRLEAVAPVARMLGVTAQANASPADKLEAIKRLQGSGHHVLMVGDGLNDGPALAAASVSMAPSSASDVGQQAADLVFMGDSLSALPRAIRTARATRRVVKQNFALAIGYNLLAVPIAIAGLATPLIAALAMSLSSIIVVANSLRLTRAADHAGDSQ